MARYIHNFDYKLSVPSNVPVYSIENGDIKDELVDADEIAYKWLKELVNKSDFEQNFDYDLNYTEDTDEDDQEDSDGVFKGWDEYDQPYHLFYYWNEDIESDSSELTEKEVVAYYKQRVQEINSPEKLGQQISLEYYKDKDGIY